MLRFYNTLTRQLEPFVPIHEGKVGLYSCGPTVYWFAHIGNLRSFLFADVLRRTLEVSGYEVKMVMNITDVGHLTDDADAGEDKMVVGMGREGKSAYEIAEFYTNAFLRDADRLTIVRANVYPRATEHIEEQVEMIRQLEKNGFTYQTSDGVYFDTSKLDSYGRLSRQKGSGKKAGARVEMGEKRQATDFALWKLAKAGPKREMEWESPWGVGFPGWHIECSAMSNKYLDAPFDIHTGGIDHIAVHHENELAQTQGALGVLEANVWMHNEFLMVDGGKMSKSLGNLYTIDMLIEKGFDPLAFRYLVLEAHYRSLLNFTLEALQGAQSALHRLRAIIRTWDPPGDISQVSGFLHAFHKALENDLHTPQGLAVMWEMVRQDIPTSEKSAALVQMDRVLGLGLAHVIGLREAEMEVTSEAKEIVKEREGARTAKDWSRSDILRDRLKELGYTIEDSPNGPILKKE